MIALMPLPGTELGSGNRSSRMPNTESDLASVMPNLFSTLLLNMPGRMFLRNLIPSQTDHSVIFKPPVYVQDISFNIPRATLETLVLHDLRVEMVVVGLLIHCQLLSKRLLPHRKAFLSQLTEK